METDLDHAYHASMRYGFVTVSPAYDHVRVTCLWLWDYYSQRSGLQDMLTQATCAYTIRVLCSTCTPVQAVLPRGQR